MVFVQHIFFSRAFTVLPEMVQIDYEIPDRIRDGYRINESIIRQAAEDGIDTLVTCDNGIAALKEISIVKQLA